MNTYADDLATVIDTLDLHDVTLIGFSTGGGEVARYVGRHGTARVAGIVLVSAVPPFMLQTDDNPGGVPIEAFDGLRAGSLADRSQLYKDLADGRFFGGNRPGENPSRGMRDTFWLQGMQSGHRNALECIAAFSATDFRPDLDKFDVPTLVIHGDDDQVVPFQVGGRASAERIKGAELKVYTPVRRRHHRHPQGRAVRGPVDIPHVLNDHTTDSTVPPRTVPATRDPKENSSEHNARHHRADPRLLGDPTELGALEDARREQGLHGAHPRLPGFRGGGRGAEHRPDTDREGHRARDHRPPGIGGRRAGAAADPDWSFRRRVFTQVLLDHRFGAAGVAINSAPTVGVAVIPLSQLKSTFPVLKNPANRHRAVGFNLEQWTYAFTNTFTEEQSRELYERYHIPASGNIFWGTALANVTPGHQGHWVDYHNDNRAPLLFISGSDDHLMPPSIQRSNAKHDKSATITETKEFAGPHLLPAKEGWEEVADDALDWAVSHATGTAAGHHRLQPICGDVPASVRPTSGSPTSAAPPC